MRILIAAFWALLAVISCRADSYVRQPSIDVLSYEISLEITDNSDVISGTTKIQLMIRSDRAASMWLDFAEMAVDRLLVGGHDSTYRLENGRVSFDLDRIYERGEIAVVEVSFHGKPAKGLLTGKNKYGRRVLFADNWPDHARYWFPSVDHPSDKARVSFTITAPGRYEVVANGRMEESFLLPDGRKTTRWVETNDLPTYCMVVGIAEFSVTHAPAVSGIALSWYSYPEDAKSAAARFSRTPLMLDYYSTLIGPYPYAKLAQVQSIIPKAGMENSSAVFYGESFFSDQRLSDGVVAHEIAHQWFGNALTISDWDHLWLSEGFATYFEALFYEHLDGPERLKKAMAEAAEKFMAHPMAREASIVDPALTDPAAKLNPLNYEKGAWVLHMLRMITGDEAFFAGIRRYYETYSGKNVASEDFQRVMESASGLDLSGFFEQWLYRPGWPEYAVQWRWNELRKELEISISQTQSAGPFDMPLQIAVAAGTRREVYTLRIDKAHQTFRIPFPEKPATVAADPENRVLKTVSVRQF